MRLRRLLLFVGIGVLAVASPIALGQGFDLSLWVITPADGPVTQGWPVVLELSFANQRAMNDAVFNQWIAEDIAAIDAQVGAGEITPEEADRQKAQLIEREIVPIRLGSADEPWSRFLSFTVDGDPSPWSVHLAPGGIPSQLLLDESAVYVFRLAIAPEETSSGWIGRLPLAAVLDTQEATDSQTWQGVTTSNVLDLRVEPEPALDDELRAAKDLAFGLYYFVLGDFDEAGLRANAVLDVDPESIDAWILLGDARFQLEAFEEAYNAYQSALNRIPAGAELPDFIVERILLARERLAQEGAEIESPETEPDPEE